MNDSEVWDKIRQLEDDLEITWKMRDGYTDYSYDWNKLDDRAYDMCVKLHELYQKIGQKFDRDDRLAFYNFRCK